MTDDKAARFRVLHRPGAPLILFNVWDAGSAKAVAKAGAPALATGSWSVAAALGFDDGERLPRDLLLEVLARIVGATDLPVTVDLESGYGETPEHVAETVRAAARAGAVGCNLEDSRPADGGLRELGEAAARLGAARRAADEIRPGFFINARTDVFFQRSAPALESGAEAVLERARAYAAAGADGLFVPGATDLDLVQRLAKASPLPLNVMRGGQGPSPGAYAAAGVARISHGPHPYRLAMAALEQAAGELYAN